MNRVIGRSVVLVLAGVVACQGDPTSDLRNGVDHLIATPSAIFLSRGVTTNVLIEALDEQGNRQGTHFTVDQVSALIDVAVDSSFGRIVNNEGDLVFPDAPTRLRYSVSPAAPVGDASFVVRAGGHEITVPVRLVPDSIAVTYSNAAPAAGDTITVTTASPFQLRPSATVDAGGARAILVDQTGNALRVVPLPGGAAGPVTVNGIALDYATTLALSLPSTTSFTPPAGLAGTGALATAPTVTLPAAGVTKLFVDEGATAAVPQCTGSGLGSPCRVWKLVLAAPRTFQVRATWEGGSDIGIYILTSAGALTTAPGACDDKGAGAAGQPEACTITLAAGTFYMVAANFSAADPVWIRMDLTGQ
jgi:hypothetical protein